MPVIIKQLVVKANIVENKNENKGMVTDPNTSKSISSTAKKQIVEESVRQVLAILDRQKTR